VLATHVVGGGEDVAERRAPQHEGAAGGVVDPVGQVGVAAGDQGVADRSDEALDVGLEPRGDLGLVDPLGRLGHAVPRSARSTGRVPAVGPQ
jgi:hypothetical protein